MARNDKQRLLYSLAGIQMGILAAGTVHGQVPEGERDALIRLYDATGGNQWKYRMGWRGAAGTECRWYGIVCNPGDGEVRHVTQILLTDNRLTGSLPASLVELEHLSVLRLSRNALEGTLPESLWHLNQLRSLVLAENNLSGQIPAALLDHPMHALILSDNRFTGFGISDSLPQWPTEARNIMLAGNNLMTLPHSPGGSTGGSARWICHTTGLGRPWTWAAFPGLNWKRCA